MQLMWLISEDNCFKVDIHMMPDLPNVPSIDKDIFKNFLAEES